MVLVVAAMLVASACETIVVNRVSAVRTGAGVAGLTTSALLTEAARAHSSEMCAAGVVAPSADPRAAYLTAEGATALDELVGSAPLDPAITEWDERNRAATDAIWAGWSGEATLTNARWQSIGVGEVECADGNLYATLVLRDDPPMLAEPADTSGIVFLETQTIDGWRYDRYRNTRAPCSYSGFQTFVIGTRVGSVDTATTPLWVKMRGGGAGWFAPDGSPQPTSGVKTEETFTQQLNYDTPGLMASAKDGAEGFRILIVSMCSHDIYAGNDNADPFNPRMVPGGGQRPTTGLTATKAAIQYTTGHYPTDDYVLHGTSAGAYGTINIAWAMQQQGNPPAGVVSDSGVLNQAWQRYVAETGISGSPGCEKATEDRGYGVLGRIDPFLGDPANEPHLLVAEGRLTVPVMHVWNRNDNNVCGATPMPCPLPGGSTPTIGAATCVHEPLRLAIAGLPAGTRSVNMAVCVEGNDAALPCDRHVVTTQANGVNSDPASPADYQAAILDWVRLRLADD